MTTTSTSPGPHGRVVLNTIVADGKTFEVVLAVTIDEHARERWQFYAGDLFALELEVSDLNELARGVVGFPPRKWPSSLKRAHHISATQANLIKTAVLLYQYVGHRLGRADGPEVARELAGEVAVDYSPAPGPQNYVYFVDLDITDKSLNEVELLYELGVVDRCAISSRGSDAEPLYFKPLVRRPIRRDKLERGAAVWDRIVARMHSAIRRRVVNT